MPTGARASRRASASSAAFARRSAAPCCPTSTTSPGSGRPPALGRPEHAPPRRPPAAPGGAHRDPRRARPTSMMDNRLKLAERVLRLEAEGILGLLPRLDARFLKAVDLFPGSIRLAL